MECWFCWGRGSPCAFITGVARSRWEFGDLIMLMDERRQLVHLGVYVADDVVLTKNGVEDLQPWVLMKFPEMRALYTQERALDLLGYRRKTG